MSFNFVWPTFSETFNKDAREMLAQALNKGEKPPIIADRIEVKELNMGTLPPDLEILEIGDLSTDRFRGIFRLTYTGDAYIVLQTKVQANPLNVPRPSLDILGEPRILFAAAPLIVPMTLRLSSLSLRAIVVLVVSRQKGITLVFKNDPLESVNVSSSFDGVESVAGYIQKEIEGQLREAFRSDLPGVIHRLSQKWLSGEVKSAAEEVNELALKKGKEIKGFEKEAKIETRINYLNSNGNKIGGRGLSSNIDGKGESISIGGSDLDNFSNYDESSNSNSRSSSPHRLLHHHHQQQQRRSIPLPIREDILQSVPESIENYDPTYGLRPNTNIPLQGGFGEYEKLIRSGTEGRGLGDVLESSGSSSNNSSEDEDGLFEPGFGPDDSFELQQYQQYQHEQQQQQQYYQHQQSQQQQQYYEGGGGGGIGIYSDEEGSGSNGRRKKWDLNQDHFETYSAVGGGTITKPRIFHTQSQMRIKSPTSSNGSLSAHGSISSATIAGGGGDKRDDFGFLSRNVLNHNLNKLKVERRSSSYSSINNGGGVGDGRAEYFAGLNHSRKNSYSSGLPQDLEYSNNNNNSSSNNDHIRSYRNTSGLPINSNSNSNQQNYRNTSTSSSSSRFPTSNLNNPSTSSYSTPASSTLPSPKESIPIKNFPPLRPDPIDLLSRSPSSVLDTSFDEDLGLPITLNPKQNDTCAHLGSLIHSNQTLSPFTRHYEHFTARSSPHIIINNKNQLNGNKDGFISLTSRLGGGGSGLVGGGDNNGNGNGNENSFLPIKAKRKRIHRIGSAKILPSSSNNNLSSSSSSNNNNGNDYNNQSNINNRFDTLNSNNNSNNQDLLGEQMYYNNNLDRFRNGNGSNNNIRRSSYNSNSNSNTNGKFSPGLGRSTAAPSEISDYFPSSPLPFRLRTLKS